MTVIFFLSASAFVLGTIAPILHDFIGLAFWDSTIGKSALGLRVRRIDGLRVGWSQSLFRAVAFWLSLGIPTVAILGVLGTPASSANVGGVSWESLTLVLSAFCIAGATVFWVFRRDSLHDSIAGTHVIHAEAISRLTTG